jgi:hypothetical protein
MAALARGVIVGRCGKDEITTAGIRAVFPNLFRDYFVRSRISDSLFYRFGKLRSLRPLYFW